MTRDEALTITGMVASHWPGNWTSPDALDAYARAIEPLDAEITTKAVLRCVDELDHYPRVATLREYVKMEKYYQELDRAQEEAVEAQRMQHDRPEPAPRLPEWVKGWTVSRHRYRDFRIWPQQDPHGFASDLMPVEEQERYMLEGSDLTIEMLFRPIGLEI